MSFNLKSRSPTLLTAIGIALTLVVTGLVVLTLLLTSGSKAVSANAAVIGALVGLGGVFTTQLVNSALEDRRAQSARETEQTQRQRELELEQQRSQNDALQVYLDHMGELLLGKGLHSSVGNGGENTGEAQLLARARTYTVLRTLNPARKASVVRFLIEARLIHGPEPIIPLFDVDLSDTKLNNANLVGIDLQDSKLIGANLRGANLRGARLYSVYEVADLSGADLSGASLNGANLTNAILKDADLEGADLEGARLNGADLSRANLSGAYDGLNSDGSMRLVANAILEERARSLEGATMPDGTHHP